MMSLSGRGRGGDMGIMMMNVSGVSQHAIEQYKVGFVTKLGNHFELEVCGYCHYPKKAPYVKTETCKCNPMPGG